MAASMILEGAIIKQYTARLKPLNGPNQTFVALGECEEYLCQPSMLCTTACIQPHDRLTVQSGIADSQPATDSAASECSQQVGGQGQLE
jgi:hypothetical protein